ncbi:MAG: DUF2806 domain-containing protein [Bryobacteraceae bacterium]
MPATATGIAIVDLLGLGAAGRAVVEGAARVLSRWVDSKLLVRDEKAKIDLEVYREIRMAEAKAITESIARSKPGTLAAAMQHRILDRELRKQINIEEAVLRAAQIADAEGTAGTSRPVPDDWFERYLGYVENVSDARVREMWSTILARQYSNNHAEISLLTLDALRFLEARHARAFEEATKFIHSFGSFVANHQLLDSVADIEAIDFLSTIGLLEKRYFNDRKILYFRDGWSLRWTPQSPVPMLDRGVLEYRLDYSGRELENLLLPERLDIGLADIHELLDQGVRQRTLSLWATGFSALSDRGHWPDALPTIGVAPGSIGKLRPKDIVDKTMFVTHVWDPEHEGWMRTSAAKRFKIPPEIAQAETGKNAPEKWVRGIDPGLNDKLKRLPDSAGA